METVFIVAAAALLFLTFAVTITMPLFSKWKKRESNKKNKLIKKGKKPKRSKEMEEQKEVDLKPIEIDEEKRKELEKEIEQKIVKFDTSTVLDKPVEVNNKKVKRLERKLARKIFEKWNTEEAVKTNEKEKTL